MLPDLHTGFSRGKSGVWYSHSFQNFPQFIVIHTVRGFGIVNKAEIDVSWNSLYFSMIFMKISMIFSMIFFFHWQFDLWFLCLFWMQLKHLEVHSSRTVEAWLENFKHYFTNVWDECNCAIVWAFLDIAFLGDWNENWPFLVLWLLLSFPNLLVHWVQHFHSIIF